MVNHAHNLEFPILISLVLQHLFYRNCFIGFKALGLQKIKNIIDKFMCVRSRKEKDNYMNENTAKRI